jgi:hypothetical protein
LRLGAPVAGAGQAGIAVSLLVRRRQIEPRPATSRCRDSGTNQNTTGLLCQYVRTAIDLSR